MIFLFPRWDMLIPWRINFFQKFYPLSSSCQPVGSFRLNKRICKRQAQAQVHSDDITVNEVVAALKVPYQARDVPGKCPKIQKRRREGLKELLLMDKILHHQGWLSHYL